jgi:hypothetical protein
MKKSKKPLEEVEKPQSSLLTIIMNRSEEEEKQKTLLIYHDALKKEYRCVLHYALTSSTQFQMQLHTITYNDVAERLKLYGDHLSNNITDEIAYQAIAQQLHEATEHTDVCNVVDTFHNNIGDLPCHELAERTDVCYVIDIFLAHLSEWHTVTSKQSEILRQADEFIYETDHDIYDALYKRWIAK